MKKSIAVIGLKGLPAFGGAASVGENIIEQLKDKYDFTVYSIASHASSSEELKGYKQIVFRNLFFKPLNIAYYYIISAFHAIIIGNYDLIHLHHIAGFFVLPVLRLKYKVISTSHGIPQATDKWGRFTLFFNIGESIFFRYSNVITSVSQPLIEYYKKKFTEQIFYIPNGISLTEINFPKISQSEYILFAAGRIISSKGCHTLLEALQKLEYKKKLLIIGDLKQVTNYDKQLFNLSVNLNVEFIGLIKDKNLLLSYLKNAKLFVYPSEIEAMSMMLLEAASQKVPIICSNIDANKAIFNETEVLFFTDKNSSDLASKIKWALYNVNEMKQKAEKAYIRLSLEHQWSDIAKMYDRQYRLLFTENS